MANLGNQKIKDTYQLVLQTDASGNLQNLSGGTPNPFIVNGNLRYVDGSQALDYILTSDASGNATWQTPGHSTNYWSANTSGGIFNSGLTSNVGIGTIAPNYTLTVSGSSTDIGWIAWDNIDLGSFVFTQGGVFISYTPSDLTVPTPLRIGGTSVRALVDGVYYYGITTCDGPNCYFSNGRGYWGVTWDGLTIDITDEPWEVISYGGSIPGNQFGVYNGPDIALQVSGSTIMSGSTNLLDIFAPIDQISGGTF